MELLSLKFDFFHLVAGKKASSSLIHALFMQLWYGNVCACNCETLILLVQFDYTDYWLYIVTIVKSHIFLHSDILTSILFIMFVSKFSQEMHNCYVVLICRALICCLSRMLFRWLQERAAQSAWIRLLYRRKKLQKYLLYSCLS